MLKAISIVTATLLTLTANHMHAQTEQEAETITLSFLEGTEHKLFRAFPLPPITTSGTVEVPTGEKFSLTLSVRNQQDLEELSKLPAELIEAIHLNGSKYEGDHLVYLKRFTELKTLVIQDIPYTDEQIDSLAELVKLKWLSISVDGFSGASWETIGKLSGLEYLSVGGKNCSPSDIGKLAGLNNLQTLRIDSIYINDEYAESLSKIENLEFCPSPMMVSDIGLQHLAKLENLRKLYLYGDVSEAGLDLIAEMESLQYVTFQKSNITDNRLRRLTGLKNLSLLSFRGHDLTGGAFKVMSEFPNLTHLTIDSEEGQLDDGIEDLGALTQLKMLDVDMDLGPGHIAAFKKLTSLVEFFVESEQAIHSGLADAIGEMTELEELIISGVTTFDDDDIHKIVNLKSVTTLAIGETNITRAGLLELAESNVYQITIGASKLDKSAFEKANKVRAKAHPDYEPVYRTESYYTLNDDGLRQMGDWSERKILDKMQGKPAPPLIFDKTNVANVGEDFSLDDLKGDLVLVHFWGQW